MDYVYLKKDNVFEKKYIIEENLAEEMPFEDKPYSALISKEVGNPLGNQKRHLFFEEWEKLEDYYKNKLI